MKFMELGFRPDTFYTVEAVRSVSCDLLNDLTIQVKSTKYLLHKYPMLSKCLLLKKLVTLQSLETETETSKPQQQVIQLVDFPGETEAFELCAKFCYGITITLSAHNVVAVRCAAEYLGMTEEAEPGENENLVQRLELFMSSCVFKSWRDSFVTLQTTKSLPLWSEDLGITNRCIEAISNGVTVSPGEDLETVLLRNRSRRRRDEVFCNGGGSKAENMRCWAEVLADLDLDLYHRTMVAIKSSNQNISPRLIGNALMIYASKRLPSTEECSPDSNLVLESVISLLPTERSAVPCSFLLQLLKMVNAMNVSPSWKMDLAIKAGNQLDEATVSELLIPVLDKSGMLYDVDVVAMMVKQFISSEMRPTRTRTENRRSRSEENINLEEIQEIGRSLSSSSPPSLGKVAKLVDSYLQEIARDVNLTVSKFVELAETIPESSRICHDDLYNAIDIYLQVHQKIDKSERKRLCRMLDCKKLTVEASKNAAQNELLPLRVIVQILFVEQARAAIGTTTITNNITTDETAILRRSFTARREGGDEIKPNRGFQGTPLRFMAFCAIPRQPKKMLCKLLSISRSLSQRN